MGEDENTPAPGAPGAPDRPAGQETGQAADRFADQAGAGAPEARAQMSHGPDQPGEVSLPAAESYGRPQAMATGAAYGALAVFGLALGLVGSFLFSGMLGPVPAAALGFTALNLVAVRLAGWGMRSKLGAVIPTVTWLVVVFSLSTKRAEGDLVITGTAPGYLFLIGGSIAAMIAVALTPSPRSWLLRGADIDAPLR